MFGRIILALTAMLLGHCFLADAQQAARVYRLGFVSSSSRDQSPRADAFRQGLQELGYVEGRNLVIEYRYAEGRSDRLPALVAELIRLKVDVIVTSGAAPVIYAAQQATRTIPIVMPGVVVDPVMAGFVASLAKPGGNITGLTDIDSELHPKRLELLKQAFPAISRVAVLWPVPQQKQASKELDATAGALKLQIHSVVVPRDSGIEGVEHGLTAIDKERPQGLVIASSQSINDHRPRIIDFTVSRRLPNIAAITSWTDAGGLMSYGANSRETSRRAATYVDKILKGANPAELPVERPKKFELAISLKTAKQIGVTIPQNVLSRADRVIK
jgi:putative tryptophan/tyrosine transport system substrate-binding protein